MSPDASTEEAAVYASLQNIARNMHNSEQAGLVIPSDTDPDSRTPLFDFSLVSNPGGKAYDTGEIVRRWDMKILTALYAELRLMGGQDATGSFALSQSKSNLIAMALEFRLKEIRSVLNSDLIRSLFKANGWDDEILPTFEYDGFDEVDLEVFSAAIQRMAATGMIEKDRDVMNRIRKSIGVDPYPEDKEVDEENLSGQNIQSKSGKGFASASGGLNGTGNSVAPEDKSVSNKANK